MPRRCQPNGNRRGASPNCENAPRLDIETFRHNEPQTALGAQERCGKPRKNGQGQPLEVVNYPAEIGLNLDLRATAKGCTPKSLAVFQLRVHTLNLTRPLAHARPEQIRVTTGKNVLEKMLLDRPGDHFVTARGFLQTAASHRTGNAAPVSDAEGLPGKSRLVRMEYVTLRADIDVSAAIKLKLASG